MTSLGGIVLANLAMVAATVVQLSAGIGFGLVGAALLLAVDPRLVPVPFAAAGMVLLFGQWRADAGSVPRGMLAPSVTGVVAGTLAGMALAVLWPEWASRRGYGIVILVAVALSLAAPPLRPTAPTLGAAALVSGVMGGFAGVHGPLMGLAVAGLNAQAVRGFLGLFWLIAYGTILLAALPAGRIALGDLWMASALLPGLAIGALLSGPARRWLHGPRLRAAILLLAATSGLALVVAE
ncbi:TSUP family transporter [Muricoccus radiodurans]|uniref:TSUP family transporter n=1 Tax=Muricoccus radiodurans TaxID=2231721 RepID=UPI003CF5C6DE